MQGFQTGDLAQAQVPTGKRAGSHRGRLALRAWGSFRVGAVDRIPARCRRLFQRADGYAYV